MLFQNLVRLLLLPAIAAASTGDAIEACYGSELISTPSNDNRTAPWGSPSIHFSSLNGTLSTCCTSLDEIRTALDDIDDQLLDLLSRRAAYVGEATRFKSTRESVNVPERNEAVLERAEQHAVQVGMPVTIARATVETILKSSMAFEECIFDSY